MVRLVIMPRSVMMLSHVVCRRCSDHLQLRAPCCQLHQRPCPQQAAAGLQVHTLCAAGPPACPQAQWQGHISGQVNPADPPTTAALPCLLAAMSQAIAVYHHWLWWCTSLLCGTTLLCGTPLLCGTVTPSVADHCFIPLMSRCCSLL